jgi:hypothetical protein
MHIVTVFPPLFPPFSAFFSVTLLFLYILFNKCLLSTRLSAAFCAPFPPLFASFPLFDFHDPLSFRPFSRPSRPFSPLFSVAFYPFSVNFTSHLNIALPAANTCILPIFLSVPFSPSRPFSALFSVAFHSFFRQFLRSVYI